MDEWLEFNLNEKILQNLQNLEFYEPTEIQRKVLVYANSKVDLIIQARTGEGKTLCYGIPIVNYVLNFYERAEDKIGNISPVALVMVPTRELGIQVKDHIIQILRDNDLEAIDDDDEELEDTEKDKENNKNSKNSKKSKKEENKIKLVHNIKVVNVLGGFAKQKQLKRLNKFNPEIIIATPGRLWELIENEESAFLNKFHRLKFLVLDEADRMMEKNHFSELKKILEFVYDKLEIKDVRNEDVVKTKNSNLIEKFKGLKHDNNQDQDDEDEKIKQLLKEQNIDVDEIVEVDNLELLNQFDEEIIEEENLNNDEEIEEIDENDNEIKKPKKEKFKERPKAPKHKIGLRTILCSATIDSFKPKKWDKKGKGKHSKSNVPTKDEATINLENLIKNIKFYNKLLFLKYNKDEQNSESNGNDSEHNNEQQNILPEKLEIEAYKCSNMLKDYYLFHLLKTHPNKSIIVFTNSISHTKKLFSIFSYFDFEISCLHSKMQQKQRMKNLEKFKKNTEKKINNTNVLFCTDVGARGLDVPQVDIVVHYHIPKTTETFIHRSGRTARALAGGKSLSLVSGEEINKFQKILNDCKINELDMITLDIKQLEKYKNIFSSAKDMEREEHNVKKNNREKKWYESKAKECELPFENDEYEENGGDDEEKINEEKLLNRKRKFMKHQQFQQKKIINKVLDFNIGRSSFLTPEKIAELNKLMKDEKFNKLNLKQVVNMAKNDLNQTKFKKHRKTRHVRRRKR